MKKEDKTFMTLAIIVIFVLVALAATAVGVICYNQGQKHPQETVKLNASSLLYESMDAEVSVGEFLGIFDDVKSDEEKLSKMIDNNQFPYQIRVHAVTIPETTEDGTKPATRYLIKTNSGDTYWVEP